VDKSIDWEREMRKILLVVALVALMADVAPAQDYRRNVASCLQELGLQADPSYEQKLRSEQGRTLRRWYFHSEAQQMAFNNCVTRKASVAQPVSAKAPSRVAR
jgi:hypothetical protein